MNIDEVYRMLDIDTDEKRIAVRGPHVYRKPESEPHLIYGWDRNTRHTYNGTQEDWGDMHHERPTT